MSERCEFRFSDGSQCDHYAGHKADGIRHSHTTVTWRRVSRWDWFTQPSVSLRFLLVCWAALWVLRLVLGAVL